MKKKYTVWATRTEKLSGIIEVEANTEEEAASIAESANEGWDWDNTDVSLEIGLIEPNGTEDDEDDDDEPGLSASPQNNLVN